MFQQIGTAELAKSLPENRHLIKKQTIIIVQYIYIYYIWHYLAILFVNICRDRSWHQDIRTELPQVCPVCPGIRLTVVSAHFREALPLKTTGGMSLQKFHEVATQRF